MQDLRIPRKTALIVVGLFSLLGPMCILRAISLHGNHWISEAFSKILSDPIYQYACIDLFAIFSLISYWVYLDCRLHGRKFWYWPILFFVFGTPAFLIFWLITVKSTRKK